MKKIVVLLITFIIYTILIKTYPIITLWDKFIITNIQKGLNFIPLWIGVLPDCKLYSAMIALAIITVSYKLFKKKAYLKMLFFWSIPLVTFILNCMIKPIVHRMRPPYELQPIIHPDSFSYVSSHTLVTICLYGMVIYYVSKSLMKKKLKISLITISTLWILFVGFSRILIGVHYPTDVLGAYLLGCLLLCTYIKIDKRLGE
jgi:undecaprenyl-diphosphatase